ncbi:type IV toxin-antitoxin system AbiEi family antitoxin domain-containing protein [Microbacterium sp. LRZ72]|uniref:type IV toxin-antitoxin system AbiEi family antitoxin domain-containing protein n=1 Tax=Microbacterium sp. LRZ72 TaxID=2942481 RepID=UPI0029A8D391|nr:type IV toxin-antitoxin system AbiEi family antitoxin domain-containing protein [Microbacterium sp. LRZ72]MDX2375972.1 type IV toxin-antitoxin system AbiEi family antitoxin domain-containing protein [Microbacterium sp. LRZ72]
MCALPDAMPAVITYAELRASGMPRRAIDAARQQGRLNRVGRGLYARAGTCEAVTAAAAHGAVPACATAARHYGLWVLDEGPPHVGLPESMHARPHSGCMCVVHTDQHPTSRFSIPPIRQVLRQILRCRGVESFVVALESALRQRLLAAPDLAWLRARVSDSGREAMLHARDDADSGLESLLRWRLRGHGLAMRSQVRIPGVGRVDFLIGDRLLIEADGRAGHEDPAARHKDLVRDAHAAAWGYVTLRFDYALVVHDWPLVEAAILAQVAAGHHLR